MKRYTLFILTVVLSMLGIQTVSAQQTQDALYIYRNDGGFNGFFFADIERIEYSKIDTLGVEHDDYVVQEVYALDSVVRIPISAIDSVTFVTPETVYKKDVVHTTESDLWNYVIGSDSVKMLILASHTPSAMIPKAGDKIVTTKSRDYLPGGFYGLVQSVSNGANGITVNCEVPDLKELFDQFVCKAAASSYDPESPAGKRLFGNENSTELTIPVYEKSLKIDLTNISYGLGSEDTWSLTGSGTLDTGVRDVLTLRVFLAVRAILGINFDTTMRMEKKSWFNLDIKGGVSGQFDIPMAETYTWITDTPFALETSAGFSVAASGEMELKIKRENVTSDYAMVQYNDCFYDEKRESAVASTHLISNVEENSLTGTFTVTAGPYFTSSLSLMKKNIGAVGTRYDAGIKAEVSAELKLTDFLMVAVPQVMPAYMLLNPTALYDVLNRDGSLKVGPFCTGKIEASLGPWKKEFKMFDVNQLYGFEGGLVPKIAGTTVAYDKDKKVLNASASLSRRTLLGNSVGFAAYYSKSGKQANRSLYDTEYYYYKKKQSFTNWQQALTGIGGGQQVTVYPITKITHLGYEMLASPYVTYTIPPVMEVTPEEITIKGNGGTETITVTDNLDWKEDTYERTVTFDYTDKSVKPWLSGKWDDNKYVITAEKSDINTARTAVVTFNIVNKDKSINLESKAVVTQEGGGNAWAEPMVLEIPREGSATFTTYYYGDFNTVRYVIPSDVTWFQGAFSGDYQDTNRFRGEDWRQFFITVSPNETGKARQDTIQFLFAASSDVPNEERFCVPVVVKQAAGPYQTSDLKSFIVGKWHHYIRTTGLVTDENYDLQINEDGTYREDMHEVGIGHNYKYEGREEGTYEITGFTHDKANNVKIHLKMTYKRGNVVDGELGKNPLTGVRETTMEVYPHFMRYFYESRYYDRVKE